MKNKKLVLSILINPINFYPPTLNALVCLKNAGFNVLSYSTDTLESLNLLSELNIDFKVVQRPTIFSSKINGFIHILLMTLKIGVSIIRKKPEVILMYDDLGLIPIYFLKFLVPKSSKLWYHNHDIIEKETLKFSLAGVAQIAQKSLFAKLDVFTIPSIERLQFFPMHNFKGTFLFLPNYPGKWLYNRFEVPYFDNSINIKLIYQGRISEGHGLLELIDLIKERKDVTMSIIGLGEPTYVSNLSKIIESKKLSQHVIILNPVESYIQLPSITSQCHIGIAINVPRSIHYETAGTASNKIYEYAALGLPIIYYDHPQYNKYLEKYEWTFKTDLSLNSLGNGINQIKSNFDKASKSAKSDFMNHLNYENNFKKVIACFDV